MTHHRFMAWAGAALISVGALLFAGSATAQVERISLGADAAQANAASYHAAVSDDGQVVAFRSTASNLIAADTNNWPDIFVRDIAGGSTKRVGFLAGVRYSLYPSISDDGRIVVLRRGEDSTARVIAHDRSLQTDTVLFAGGINQFFEPVVSGNGQFIAFFSPFSLSDLLGYGFGRPRIGFRRCGAAQRRSAWPFLTALHHFGSTHSRSSHCTNSWGSMYRARVRASIHS